MNEENKILKNINRKRFFTTLGLGAFAGFLATSLPFSVFGNGNSNIKLKNNSSAKIKVNPNPLAVSREARGRNNGA